MLSPGTPPADIRTNNADGFPGFLGTPSEKVKKYDPATGKITIIP